MNNIFIFTIFIFIFFYKIIRTGIKSQRYAIYLLNLIIERQLFGILLFADSFKKNKIKKKSIECNKYKLKKIYRSGDIEKYEKISKRKKKFAMSNVKKSFAR